MREYQKYQNELQMLQGQIRALRFDTTEYNRRLKSNVFNKYPSAEAHAIDYLSRIPQMTAELEKRISEILEA